LDAALAGANAQLDVARLAALIAKNLALDEADIRRTADAAALGDKVAEGNAEHTLLANAANAIRDQASAQATAKSDERITLSMDLADLQARRDQAWLAAWNAIALKVGDWLTPRGLDNSLGLIDGLGNEFERLDGVWDRAQETGSGWLGSVYQVLGVGFYDLIGVTGIYNGYSGEELISLNKLGPWERATSFINGVISLAGTVMGGARGVSGARAWRAGRCSWNPLTNCFVAGTQVVIGEVVEEAAEGLAAANSPPWKALGLTFVIVGVGGVVLLENRRRGKVKAGRRQAVDAFFAEERFRDNRAAPEAEGELGTATDALPELTLDEFQDLCDCLLATDEELTEASEDTEVLMPADSLVPSRSLPRAGARASRMSSRTGNVAVCEPQQGIRIEPVRKNRALGTGPIVVPRSGPRRPRSFGRWLPIVWLAACLIPAGFCSWRSDAPRASNASETRTVAQARYITRSIEDIGEGDFVLARDAFGRDVGVKRVAEVYRRVSDHLRILTFRAADGTEQTLKTTDEHPFWTENRQAWIEAKNLAVGDTFIGPHGEFQTLVATVYEPHPDRIRVFNFQVEDYHSYFAADKLAGQMPVLVHNADYDENLAPDIAKKVRQFEKKSLRDQKSVYDHLRRTYQEHLEKYGQKPGATSGETNRMERELAEMRRILEGRGQGFGSDGELFD
jgi:hypothetical protein